MNFRASLLTFCFALLTFGLGVACGPSSPAGTPKATDSPWFVDRAHETGLDFVHVNGMSGKFYYAEIIAPGAALFDYDQDGDLDVFLVQGRPLGAGASGETGGATGGRLFRNDLVVNSDGTRTLHFTDVTAQSGIIANDYGMGVAAGDFDNDGCVDLYLTNFGRNHLWRNNCNGTFTDVTAKSGTGVMSWSV